MEEMNEVVGTALWLADGSPTCYGPTDFLKEAREVLVALESLGHVIVPVEPTEEMVEAFYDGAEAARDEHFENLKRKNEVREVEGKKPFPYGIAPIEWFPPAYLAMIEARPRPSSPPVPLEPPPPARPGGETPGRA